MKVKRNNIVLVLVTIMVMLFQLTQPSLVLADGETPPPTDSATEIVPTDAPVDPATEVVPTDLPISLETPVPADADSISEEPASTSPVTDPVETSTPAPEAFTATAEPVDATAEPIAADAVEQPTLPEVLQGIPGDTNLVVLDENGQPLPLVTQEAAEAILTMDPVWCPDGQAPTPGANGCSSSFANLFSLIGGFVPTGNGTIWIQSGSDATHVWIDGSSAVSWQSASNYALTFQGGWSGVSGDATIGSNSILSDFWMGNWNNDIFIKNITYTGSAGLMLDQVQDVQIVDSNFVGNGLGSGAQVNGANDVSIINSTFDGNPGNGLNLININNNVTISDSVFINNDLNGVGIWTAGNVTITSSTFDGNGVDGAYMQDVGNVTIADSTFTGNTMGGGANIHYAGDVNITNSTFDGNGEDGAFTWHAGNVTIADSTFNGNGWSGAYMWDVGNVTIADSAFTGNTEGGAGVEDAGNANITNSTFSGNILDGLGILDILNGFAVSNSIFGDNSGTGIWIHNSSGTVGNSVFYGNDYGVDTSLGSSETNVVTINNSTFINNRVAVGAHATAAGASVDLTLNCLTYNNNQQNLESAGNITLTDIPCIPIEADKKDPVDEIYYRPAVVVPSGINSVEFEMDASDCSLTDSIPFEWANGDVILISCVAGAVVRVSRVDNTSLVNDLPSGFQYASAFKVEIFRNGIPVNVMTENGYIGLSFASNGDGGDYGIMYWDDRANDWMSLKEFQLDPSGFPMNFPLNPSSPADEYRVLKGVQHVINGDLHSDQVTTNFTGIYVLVQK